MKNIMKKMYVSRDSSRFTKIALIVAGFFLFVFFNLLDDFDISLGL